MATEAKIKPALTAQGGSLAYSETVEAIIDREWGDSETLVRVSREEYDRMMSDRGFRLGNRIGPWRVSPEDRTEALPSPEE